MPIVDRGSKVHVTAAELLQGAAPVTAANYGAFFIADRRYRVTKIEVVWETASASGTVQVERLQGTEAKDAGDDLLASALSTASTAKTVATPALVTNTSLLVLEPGNRLGLVSGGTLTSLASLAVTCQLEPMA